MGEERKRERMKEWERVKPQKRRDIPMGVILMVILLKLLLPRSLSHLDIKRKGTFPFPELIWPSSSFLNIYVLVELFCDYNWVGGGGDNERQILETLERKCLNVKKKEKGKKLISPVCFP